MTGKTIPAAIEISAIFSISVSEDRYDKNKKTSIR